MNPYYVNSISETERSRLLFLLNAIQVSPHRVQEFIAVLEQNGVSSNFSAVLQQLREAKDVTVTATLIRESMR